MSHNYLLSFFLKKGSHESHSGRTVKKATRSYICPFSYINFFFYIAYDYRRKVLFSDRKS